jgi:molybdopterin-guanine dinucleotide biosynthesis protein B
MSEGVPVVAVVGASGSGKTTLIEALIKELSARGISVATVKHAHGGYQLDKEGSDSARHTAAGAVGVLLVGPSEYAALWPSEALSDEAAPARAVELFGGADLILVEGYAALKGPKIFVHRKGVPMKAPLRPEEVICAVSDEDCGFEPRFAPNQTSDIAELIAALIA